MRLESKQQQKFYKFERVTLQFTEGRHSDVFAHKNNKTVDETFQHKRYAKLRTIVMDRYANALNRPLGELSPNLGDGRGQAAAG